MEPHVAIMSPVFGVTGRPADAASHVIIRGDVAAVVPENTVKNSATSPDTDDIVVGADNVATPPVVDDTVTVVEYTTVAAFTSA